MLSTKVATRGTAVERTRALVRTKRFRHALGFGAALALAGVTELGFAEATGPVPRDPDAESPRSTEAALDAHDVILPVRVSRVTRQDSYEVTELHAGTVTPLRTSELGFERSGRLIEVLARPGDRVEAGQVLARLDRRQLEADRRERVAVRSQLEARVALAKRTRERQSRLHAAGFLASQQLDETRFSHAEQQAQLAAARAAIESLDVRLELSDLVAPFAGTIVERSLDEGTVVAPGQVVLRLVDHERQVHLGVPPLVATRLHVGDELAGSTSAGSLGLKLEAIVPEVEAATRTLRLILRVDAGQEHARPGELARLALPHRVQAEGYWLPLSALSEGRRGLWVAYVATPDPADAASDTRVLEARPVDVLHTAGERAFVRGTLYENDEVVIEGVHRLVPNQRVRVGAYEEAPRSRHPQGAP